MRPRYLIASADGADAIRRIRGALESSRILGEDFQVRLEAEHLLVISQGPGPVMLGAQGLIVGSLFRRGRRERETAIEGSEREAAVATRGASLMGAFWGAYVAVVVQPSGTRTDVLRGPFGDLPCYVARLGDALLFASDVGLLVAAGLPRPRFHPEALSRHLAAPDIRRGETCLQGVRELGGGKRITIEGSASQDLLWSPWRHAAADRQIVAAADAASRVRNAALECVGARSAEAGRVLLKLSGGLDSSIVAASLALEGRSFSCLTLATDDPAGDERAEARLVAEALEAPLLERLRTTAGVDVRRSAAARLPRPTARSFAQESARIAAEAASELSANVIFDGGGGDNIFCSLQSVRPVADCLLARAGLSTFIDSVRIVAGLAQASVWAVTRRAWTASRRPPQYPWPLDTRLLSAAAAAETLGALAHPWLEAPPGALPGKAAHVALITAAQSVAEGADVEDALPAVSPLISQPLVEACLEAPSWLWFSDGLNRAVARRAFADDLPRSIVRRRSKGAPDSFAADLYEANREAIRSMLCGGVLADAGLLDLPAVSAVLDSPGPLRGHDFLRCMQLADAEAWARCWV